MPKMPSSLAAAVLLSAGAGCGSQAQIAPEFDASAAWRYAEAQLGFGPRIPGSAGHRRMAAWLDSLLRTRADTLVVQRWTHVTRRGDSLPLVNFIARFNPAAPTRLLFLAHWDTRPRADDPASRDTLAPVPGANDGASGVAILLGMADALKARPPAVGVDLLFVDGEDYGDFNADADVLLGSRYYAEHPVGPQPRLAILLDMVGDKDLRIAPEYYSQTGAPEVVELVWETARKMGYGNVFVADGGPTLTDDHVPLQQAGMRAIDVIDFTYPWHHTPDDTLDKISAQSLKIVGDVMLAVVRGSR
jgi:glutaminyl-peptide cyclotransferase